MVTSAVFSPDGRTALSDSYDMTLRLWDVATGNLVSTFEEEANGAVAFAPDGRTVLSSDNNALKLWDVATGKVLRAFKGRINGVLAVAFSPDGRAISGSDDTALKLLGCVDRQARAHFRRPFSRSPFGGVLP
jgi:WD40 repeat protein